MYIKKKHLAVVLFSSGIIAAVMVSTLVGYVVYIEWKKDSTASMYYDSLHGLTADMFKADIVLFNMNTGIAEGVFEGAPIVEGSLKNNSSKIISSIMLEVAFLRADGSVAYRKLFFPFGENKIIPISTEGLKTVLLPGFDISFKYPLRDCPQEVISQLYTKSEFARAAKRDRLEVKYSIVGMSVL